MNTFSQMSSGRRIFLTGTLLLTGTGFICRILGFFYRIFLSRTIGAEGLGLYNMIYPVFGICFALCAGSMQTALSQYIAAHTENGKAVFRSGLFLSLTIASVFAFLISRHSDFLARNLLMEPLCASSLPLIGISIPFAALHACINGYYYGVQNARVPAFSQLAEQLLRMAIVFLIASFHIRNGGQITVRLAVIGHLIGEIASAVFTLLCLYLIPPQTSTASPSSDQPFCGQLVRPAAALLSLALPLMGNRFILNLLASAEAVWIPHRLKLFGLNSSDAFAVYGVLTGMALPFVLFPSAITNSMAVLLLPKVAQAQAEGQKNQISASIQISLRYSLSMGILCIAVFTMFGNTLGSSVFHNAEAGTFIRILGWLCPFLYLATTMGSILNGLGRTRTTFFHNVIALLLRLTFVLIGIPRFGILAYLWGMLASELTLSFLHLWSLKRQIPFIWNAWEMIGKPMVILMIAIGVFHFISGILFHPFLSFFSSIPVFIFTAIQILILCCCYGGLFLLISYGFHRPYL